MRKSELIKFNGKELTVKELTVNQIIKVMDELENFKPNILDVLMDMPVPSPAFFLSIGMNEKDFDYSVAPSEIEPLYEVVLKVNPTLAATMERLKQVGIKVMKSENSLSD